MAFPEEMANTPERSGWEVLLANHPTPADGAKWDQNVQDWVRPEDFETIAEEEALWSSMSRRELVGAIKQNLFPRIINLKEQLAKRDEIIRLIILEIQKVRPNFTVPNLVDIDVDIPPEEE